MKLYLDANSNVFLAVTPEGGSLPATITAGAIEFDVSDDDWYNVYLPAWQNAQDINQDLVINSDGSVYMVARTLSDVDQAIVKFRDFMANPAPGNSHRDDAIKALITVVRAMSSKQ